MFALIQNGKYPIGTPIFSCPFPWKWGLIFFYQKLCKLVYRGGKGSWGYSVAATVSPQRDLLYRVRSKKPEVWGTGKNVVYGYSSIQRGNSGTKYAWAHLTPHRTPQQCFSLPSLATEEGKKEPPGVTVSPRLFPRRTENISVPGPHRVRNSQ